MLANRVFLQEAYFFTRELMAKNWESMMNWYLDKVTCILKNYKDVFYVQKAKEIKDRLVHATVHVL